ncbi:MAG: GAF domain-containing protein [Anaerolineae bacterium]|jgi:PAS domain S-box-containing protein
MISSRADLQRTLVDRSQAVVEGWYQAVHGSTVGLLSPSELRSELYDVWERVVAFILAEDGDSRSAELIGASFVSLGIKPEAVACVLQVVLETLTDDLPRHVEAVVQPRLPNLIAGMTSGLYETGTQKLLEQQEEIRAAQARALRRAEDQLRIRNAGIESSINGIMTLDLEGNLTYVNPAFLEMWGYDSERQVLGRNASEFGAWEGNIDQALAILDEYGGWIGELKAARHDGTHFDVQASVSPIRDEAGRVYQLMVFFVDITERKKSQEALRQSAIRAAFLNEIGEEIAAQRTAEGVLERAVHLAQETFGFHQVGVLLLDRGQQVLEAAALAGDVEGLGDHEISIPVAEGITGWAARHETTVVAPDVADDPRYICAVPKEVPTRSELAVPIISAGHVVGVIDVQSPETGAFGSGESVVLETLADQIAVALENARLYQALQQELAQRRRAEEALRMSVQRLETVHEIDQAILSAKSREEIARAVVRDLQRLIPCQRASIDIFDWEAEELTVLAAVQTIGEGRAGTGARFPLTQRQWLFDLWEGIKSFLAAPIGIHDELMGLLTLGSDEVHGFEDEHKPIVKELADTVAIALQQAHLLDSIRQQRERLRGTMARLAEVEETERRRVVRELHDQVGQNLTALDLNLSLVRSRLEKQGLVELHSRVDDSLALVEQTNERIRRLMVDLRPPVLDDYGLMSALHWYGDQFSERTGIDVVVEGKEEATRDLSLHVENALFRIAQEALNNTAKHAQADEVTIALSVDETVIRLRICDDGVGFEPGDLEGQAGGWGLLTMRERAESVGARCLFGSTSEEGACIVVEVPK